MICFIPALNFRTFPAAGTRAETTTERDCVRAPTSLPRVCSTCVSGCAVLGPEVSLLMSVFIECLCPVPTQASRHMCKHIWVSLSASSEGISQESSACFSAPCPRPGHTSGLKPSVGDLRGVNS